MLQVFISSTKLDLVEHRRAVKEALLKAGFHPIDMDDFMAQPTAGVETSLKEVDKANALIGIYAWRYGNVPEGSPLSITEQEFNRACERKIPCFCFLADESFDWDPKLRDIGEAAESLEAFKKKLSKLLTFYRFTTPDKLATDVVATLLRWEEDRKAPRHSPGPRSRKLNELLAKVSRRADDALAERIADRPLQVELGLLDPSDAPGDEPRSSGRRLLAEDLLELLRDRDRLLILGAPGSGKSVALLRLACDLAATIGTPTNPWSQIPVFLSLSSWRSTDRNLIDWLARELNDDYSCGPVDVRKWVNDGAILPLLDGLDEVAPNERAACVIAINRYMADHGGGLVISSRPVAYEALPERLHVQAEVVVKPLTSQSVETCLAGAEPGYESLRKAVRNDGELGELARSPLMLRLMMDAFQDSSALDVGPLMRIAAKDQPRQVVETYVKAMQTRPGSTRYGPDRTRRSLSWLAREMIAHRMVRFEIERLQPTWLASPSLRWFYAIVSRGLAGTLFAAIFMMGSPDYWFLPLCGLITGVLAGVVDALPVWKAPASGKARDNLRQTTLRILISGLAAFGVFLSVARQWTVSAPFGLCFTVALAFGLVFGTRPGGLRGDTKLFETLRLGWSWKGSLLGTIGAVLTGLALEVFLMVFSNLALKLGFWVFLFLQVGAFGFFAGGIIGGIEGSIPEVRKSPNQGLTRIARNTFRVFWFLTLPLAIVALIEHGFISNFPLSLQNSVTSLWQGTTIGLMTGMWFGGIDILQHFLLRFLLSATGHFPFRWVRFLDHAADRGLLYQVEGGYEFPHGMVRDYFASLPRRGQGVVQ